MNRVKVAEFIDYNRDGRIDDVFVIGNAEHRWDTMNRRATTRCWDTTCAGTTEAPPSIGGASLFYDRVV
jgi:hypothetical protein